MASIHDNVQEFCLHYMSFTHSPFTNQRNLNNCEQDLVKLLTGRKVWISTADKPGQRNRCDTAVLCEHISLFASIPSVFTVRSFMCCASLQKIWPPVRMHCNPPCFKFAHTRKRSGILECILKRYILQVFGFCTSLGNWCINKNPTNKILKMKGEQMLRRLKKS